MNSYPFIGNLNFTLLEEVGGVIFQNHHRRKIREAIGCYEAMRRYEPDLMEARKQTAKIAKIAKIARQLVKLLEGVPGLRLWKEDLKDLAKKAEALPHGNHRGRPSNPSFAPMVCDIFDIYKDAGGKSTGCYWNEEGKIFKGKTLDLICAIFDQSKIRYSKNTVAIYIKRIGQWTNATEKFNGAAVSGRFTVFGRGDARSIRLGGAQYHSRLVCGNLYATVKIEILDADKSVV